MNKSFSEIREELLRIIPPEMAEFRKSVSKWPWKIPPLIAEILRLERQLRPIIERAWPDGSEKDISWMTAELAGLWEVSRKHIILIRKLLKMKRKPDTQKLRQISQELYINWFSDASTYMKTLEPELARFKRSLFKDSPRLAAPRRIRKR